MELKIIEFNIENVFIPLDNSINILLQKIKDFDYKKIYDKINGTICSAKQLILKDINRKKELLELGSNALKSPLDAIKDKVEDQFNSSILNDLFSKFTNKTIDLPDLSDSEIGQQILNFTEKVEDLRKNGSSELLEKMNNFHYQIIINLINEKIAKTTNYVINNLLIIQDQLNEIKDLRDEYRDTNATANKIIAKLKQSMKSNLKKIKDNIFDFLENNQAIKPIIEQLKNAEESIKKAINESEIIQIIDAFFGDKLEEIDEFINSYNIEIKNQLEEAMYNIQELLKNATQGDFKDQLSNIPDLTLALLEEIKNILHMDSFLEKIKEQFNGTNLEDFNPDDITNLKEITDNLKEKAKEFINNTFLLKLIVDNAEKLNDDLKNELKKAGISDAIKKYIDTLKSLPEALNELNLENNEKINGTLYDILDKIKALYENGILDKLSNSTEDLVELLSKIQELPEVIKTKINETEDKIEETIKEIKEYISKINADIDSKLEEAGVKDAFDQYIQGIFDLEEILNETKLNREEYLEDLFYTLGEN